MPMAHDLLASIGLRRRSAPLKTREEFFLTPDWLEYLQTSRAFLNFTPTLVGLAVVPTDIARPSIKQCRNGHGNRFSTGPARVKHSAVTSLARLGDSRNPHPPRLFTSHAPDRPTIPLPPHRLNVRPGHDTLRHTSTLPC